MTRAEVRQLQEGLNHFVAKFLRGLGPLHVDGKMGQHTEGRIRTVKFYLGYTCDKGHGSECLSPKVDLAFRQRMWHPKTLRYSTPARVARGMARRRKQRAAHAHTAKAAARHGLGTFDGIHIGNWLIPYLEWAREHGRWKGRLVSGYRDPIYSEHLCFAMCGRPTCPGKCAGRMTNHQGIEKPHGAMDVTDYVTFGEDMKHCPLEPKLVNHLPNDPVHYSATGY
jgi:hypothetical protein